MVVAIDPGVNGGLSYGTLTNKGALTSVAVDNMYDSISKIIQFLKKIQQETKEISVFIEYQAHRGYADAKGGRIFNIIPLMINYNRCLDACELLNLPVTKVTPKQWQTHFGLVHKWKNTTEKKNAHKQKAIELADKYNHDIKLTLKTMDAYLILLWGALYNS